MASDGRVSPSVVGYDIACGNKAVFLDADVSDVRANIATIRDDVYDTLSFGVSRKNDEDADNELSYHTPTVPVLHSLIPIGVAMTGAGKFDPFSD